MNEELNDLVAVNKYSLPLFKVIPSLEGGIDRISIVESPAIEESFLKLKADVSIKLSINEAKRHILGPALIPNKPIYRRDSTGFEYLIYFTQQTIEELAISFFNKGELNGVDMNHSQIPLNNMKLVSSYILSDDLKDERFTNLPSGSWIVEYKVLDDDFWFNEIVSGNLKGFSIDGSVNFVRNNLPQSTTQLGSNESINSILDELITKIK